MGRLGRLRRRLRPAVVDRGLLDRVDDLLVARAAAEVAVDRLADLVPRRPRILEQERMRHEDHPGRAEAALDRAALHERPLQRVQRAVRRGHALDREHAVADYVLHALDADLQRRIVDQDGARAARARVLRAGQVEVLAEELDEPPLAGGIGDLEVAPVDVELHSRHSSSGGSSGSADILIGSANSRRPVAWKMALAIAGARISLVGSPMAFAPLGDSGSGFSTMIAVISGRSVARGMR